MPRVYPPLDGRKPDTGSVGGGGGLPKPFIEAAAGFNAGVISTLAVHPFDVVKLRLQVNQASTIRVGGSIQIARDIIRADGPWRGLYRGLGPNLLGNSTSWAVYFMLYGNVKDGVQSYRGTDAKLTSLDYFLASGLSGMLTSLALNPIWVIKTRMLSTSRSAPGAYTTMLHGARQILRTEGPRGFYRGLVPSLFGVTHGGIQFMVYEELKHWRKSVLAGQGLLQAAHTSARTSVDARGNEVVLANTDYIALAAAAKIVAGSITYPYQVVRSRLQTYDASDRYRNARDLLRQLWAKEGIAGFYKGLTTNIVRIVPACCVTFLVYENTKFYLPRFWDDELNATTSTTVTTP